MDYYEKDKEYKKDKGHKKPVFWHFFGFLVAGIALLLALFCIFRPDPPPGPPPAGEPAFGSLYGDDTPIEVEEEDVGSRVDFDSEGPALNTIPDAEEDEIVIETSGVYEISADVTVLATGNDTIEFAVATEMEGVIEESTFEAGGTGQTGVTAGRTVQVSLNEGDAVFVEIVDVTGAQGNPPEYQSASLTVNRIGPLVDTE